MNRGPVVQVKRLRTLAQFRARLDELGIADSIGADDQVDPTGPLAAPLRITDGSAGSFVVGNRFAVLPMEGWDGSPDGRPTDLVRRRWERFGLSGAKLIWGGEAVAVRADGRANPGQLVIDEHTEADLAELRNTLEAAHRSACGGSDDLLIGLQLTHSGRWSRPAGSFAPLIAHAHPGLAARTPGATPALLGDDDLDRLVEQFALAARRARDAGFAFVDVKHCHGYLLHELLGARDRPGPYGGSFEGRTRFLRRVVARVRDLAPDLAVGVRLSAYDLVPFTAGPDGSGVPVDDPAGLARYAFGADATGLDVDLEEPHRFLELCADLGIGMVCVTAGSPYYNPHIQRPAFFPPSDGYTPPNDPLVDVARMLGATARLAQAHPSVVLVGTGYSYLQQWLAHVAQHAVRTGAVHSVGIGRGMLSYPELPAHVLAGRPLHSELICRTFSDCTTAPRNGLVSGCYPLDGFYRDRPERIELAAVKKRTRHRTRTPETP